MAIRTPGDGPRGTVVVAPSGSWPGPAPVVSTLVSAVIQLALATLIESGRFDRHLRRMRATYASRRGALVEALGRHAPGVRLTGLAAGFHAVARLPQPAGEQDVIAAARARSVGLYGMSICRSSGQATPAQLVLGFGNLGERSIQEGVRAVGDLLQARRPG